MTPRLKIFLSAFLISLPFWWGTNAFGKSMGNFFFWQNVSQNSRVFAAQIAIEEKARFVKPVLKKDAENLAIDAKAAFSFYLGKDGEKKILFEKNIGEHFPIASLTKLMTAYVVLENYDLSAEMPDKTGDEFFPVEYFFYPLLIKSDNDAAEALANNYDDMSEKKFVRLMNEEAEKLHLQNTLFFNPSGLDPDDLKRPNREINSSTAEDLAKLTEELLKYPTIWNILSTPKFDLFGPELENTNELLGEISSMVGGKTGYTARAGGCMILVLKAPKDKGYIINVILGANGPNSRFEEMKKMTDWLNSAFKW